MHNFYNKIPEFLEEKRLNLFDLQKTQEKKNLETEKIIDIKELGGGMHETSIVTFANGEKGVFKPKSGEVSNDLHYETKAGSYYKREEAAYIVDRFFDFDLVPATVNREINGEEGSLQRFVPNAFLGYEYESYKDKKDDEKYEKELMKLWIFDLIIWSTDRHGKGFLVKRGKIYAIDNGFSFGDDFWRKSRDYFDKPIPGEIVDKFKKFFENKDENEKILRTALENLLDKEEIDACIKRINKIGSLIINGVIPKKEESNLKYK